MQLLPDERKALWREPLLRRSLFRELHDVLRRQRGHAVGRDFVLETIVMRMPQENYERVFDTCVRWARFGGLFSYDEAAAAVVLQAAPE